jgi:L-malate glycosyltransferase
VKNVPPEVPRILFLINALLTGGAERHLVELIRYGVAARRFDAEVLCLKQPGDLASELAEVGVSVQSLGVQQKYDPSAIWRVIQVVANSRPHLIYTHCGQNELFLGQMAQTLFGTPRVCVVHSTPKAAAGEHFSRLQRALMRRASAVVAVAPSHRRSLLSEGLNPHRTVHISNGVDQVRFQPQHGLRRELLPGPAGHPTLGVVGTLNRDKGHHILLAALVRVLERHPDAVAIFIGAGPQEAELHDRVAHMGLSDHVVFAGRRHDISRLLPELDVFVLPSFRETFSVATLEAMAVGLPVVVTRVGSMPEMVIDGHSGFVIEPDDPAMLADRLTFLLTHTAFARAMGHAARKRVEALFTLDRMVARYSALFRQLVSDPGYPLEVRGEFPLESL